DRGLKLTTQLYYTPSGRSIQATGITPDIIVQNLQIPEPKNTEDTSSLVIHEEDLLRHLENGNKKEKGTDTKNATNTTAAPTGHSPEAKDNGKADNLLYTDYQLYEGLNLLKALTIAGNPKGK
nr:peptidase S41 [Gammaproteobacteria bacterium]